MQKAATITLSKFMCVSATYCEQNLPLLLTILEKSQDPEIRSNIIIALGDIAVCFNSLLEEHIQFLYNRLGDSDTSTKKNTLMVLTHLILNGMIKVKGQLGEMAKCLEDSDTRISDLAKLFFTELASKDNAVYNNLPDIISHLSKQGIAEEKYERIIRFLFTFVKDKNSDSMVEKLCQKFRTAEAPRNWRDISLCLSLLPFKTERSFKKMVDGFIFYQDMLHENTVYKHFVDIISKAKLLKAAKNDIKAIVEEFEQKLKGQRVALEEDREAVENAQLFKEGKKPSRRERRVKEYDEMVI